MPTNKMYFRKWYKMFLFGFQDIAIQNNFAKWKALVQKGTLLPYCTLVESSLARTITRGGERDS